MQFMSMIQKESRCFMKNKEMKYRILLAVFVIFIAMTFLVVLQQNGGVYGSIVDWLGQHVAFGDYFRDNFYETGNLYPDFSPQLGGGVNNAQLIYYGLFRPEILISYLFPMIPMYIWLSVSSVLMVIFSVEVFYQWLRNENVSIHSAFIASLIFICAGPIMFHTHRHLMFTNYLPWMILTFMGIKRYIQNQKAWQMLLGIVMIILSSYFYSVSALFMCGIYAIFCIFQEYEKVSIKLFLTKVIHLCGLVALGVGMAAFILLPIGLSMLSQNRGVLQNPSLMELIKPDLDMSGIITNSYTSASYSVGMGMLAYIGVVYGVVYKRKSTRILSLLILSVAIFPVFCYILNGMQYIRQKSLIPMIPLIGFLLGQMLDSIKTSNKKTFFYCLPLIFLPFLFMKNKALLYIQLFDAILCVFILFIYMKKKCWYILFVCIIIPFLLLKPVNADESFLKSSSLKQYTNEKKKELAKSILDNDHSLYRFDDQVYAVRTTNQVLDQRMLKSSIYSSNSNQSIVKFFFDEMAMPGDSSNRANMHTALQPFYQSMMGVKYMITAGEVPYGYHVIKKSGKLCVIKNDDVMPLAYATSNIMDLSDYEILKYPYNMETLFQRTIVANGNTVPYKTKIKEYTPSYSIESIEGMTVKKIKDGYRIKVKKSGKIRLRLDNPIENRLLILDLPIREVKKEKTRNVRITINGIDNRRSKTNDYYANHRDNFRYVLSDSEKLEYLNIDFSKGEYTISNPKTYLLAGNILKERRKEVDEMKIDNIDKKQLTGEIMVSKDGYFVTSLPYQIGFDIKLDGKSIPYEEVNTAFIGFPIKKGNHTISITFKMPGKNLGIATSGICLGLSILLHINRKYKWRK